MIDVLHVIPPFEDAGKNGLCRDYDEDCMGFTYREAFHCWRSATEEGICPYLD